MSTDDKRVRDCLEQIQARVDNWAQGNGYGPGGWPQDAPVHDVIFLLNHIADLEEEIDDLRVEAREKNAWEGRYNALLEECEASRPREVKGNVGTIVIDRCGNLFMREPQGDWSFARFEDYVPTLTSDGYAPYTIVHTPEEES